MLETDAKRTSRVEEETSRVISPTRVEIPSSSMIKKRRGIEERRIDVKSKQLINTKTLKKLNTTIEQNYASKKLDVTSDKLQSKLTSGPTVARNL